MMLFKCGIYRLLAVEEFARFQDVAASSCGGIVTSKVTFPKDSLRQGPSSRS